MLEPAHVEMTLDGERVADVKRQPAPRKRVDQITIKTTEKSMACPSAGSA